MSPSTPYGIVYKFLGLGKIEHTVFPCILNFVVKCLAFLGGKSAGKLREHYFFGVLVYFKGIIIILSQLYCILLLCCKIEIGVKYALFGVKFFRLIF